MTKILRSLSDIRNHFSQNEIPHYFISASNFNMMGMHEWVKGWKNVTLIDSFDGKHPHLHAVPSRKAFDSIQEIDLHLLQNGPFASLQGERKGRAIFLFFDEEVEALCERLGLEILLPPHRLVHEMDSKIVTTEIGNQAGVKSVPNVLAKVGCFEELERVASGLGRDWVVQSAYGDSGKTTFFISDRGDFDEAASRIAKEEKVKVMRRISCTGTAIEACATRWGTFVGPLMTELIGVPQLTPYPGGWCGNELYESAFSPEIRRLVLEKTRAMGDALYRRGYRGYFELDFLIDRGDGEVYLGELNSRITGISAMTNLSDFCTENIPLFLFHLLEFDREVELEIDADAFNEAVLHAGASGVSSQAILKYTDESLKIVTSAPQSVVYSMDDAGRMVFRKAGWHRRDALGEDEAYLLRIMEPGEYVYEGADLAILFLNRVIGNGEGGLNLHGEKWISALQESFEYRNLRQEERSLVEFINHPAGIKSGGRRS
ncbi:MAG: biotin carboxylase [Burkholderiales bacterium]|nr:biotin carboxylase [Burkholderiales bacterium]